LVAERRDDEVLDGVVLEHRADRQPASRHRDIVADGRRSRVGGLGTSGETSRPDEPDARTRLREAALERIGRCGLHATSTREIIAAAGLRNPSAINYYFGSKAALLDDLVAEVHRDESRIIQRQVALARGPEPPTAEAWAGVAVDAAIHLLSSLRGCLLIRVWAAQDAERPDAVEEFLSGDHPLAVAWRDAVVRTFPDLPAEIAIARNHIVLRTLQWMTVRRAGRVLEGAQDLWGDDPLRARAFVLEVVLNILTPPTVFVPTAPVREP
jgi:AcrR family transcriptional regulator